MNQYNSSYILPRYFHFIMFPECGKIDDCWSDPFTNYRIVRSNRIFGSITSKIPEISVIFLYGSLNSAGMLILKKRSFAEPFWGFWDRVKDRTLKMVLAERGFRKKIKGIISYSLLKMVQSDTKRIIFKCFLIEPLLLGSHSFCSSKKFPAHVDTVLLEAQ